VLRWLLAFAFTQLAEIPVWRRVTGCTTLEAFGASLLTHPLVWVLAVLGAWEGSWAARAAVGETYAVVAEAMYMGLVIGRPRAIVGSLAANATSFVLGLVAYRLFG
jgi:hypothetical protein